MTDDNNRHDHFMCSCGVTADTDEELDKHFCDHKMPDAEYRWL